MLTLLMIIGIMLIILPQFWVRGILNKYTKEFFSWDHKDRILNNLGVEYSFSGGYMELSNGIKISAVKLYPVSPHLNKSHIEKAVKIIMKQKALFDQKIWKKK